MKTTRIITVLLIASLSLSGMAQDSKQEKRNQLKAELKAKAPKEVRKEAKRLKKEGWQVLPGSLPLEKQLERSYVYELEEDQNGDQLYLQGRGQSRAESIDAARIQATELARLDIAGSIGSEATSLIENLVGNKQLPKDEAATITTLMMQSKTIFSQKIGRVRVGLESYRTLSNGNKEVSIRLFTKASEIKEIAKNAVREELEKRGLQLGEKLDNMTPTKQ